ncbi:MAG: cell division protein ZapA [Flavobacteriaceae bacterium]|nr:cell division protein ZapA [Flavobacteriaceae bacterium]
MRTQRINIVIAGRSYPLNVPVNEEETLRKVGKQIEEMLKDYEKNYAFKDKQDALAMCALRLGTSAEMGRLNSEKNIQSSNDRLKSIHQLLDNLEK